MIRFWLFYCCSILLCTASQSVFGAEPLTSDTRYKLDVVASDPDIMTPIGMTFDRRGRLLVVESHTHQSPPGYQGPKGDRLRMLSDSDGNGQLDQWTTFAEGFTYAMNVFMREDGGVLLVTRQGIILLRDTNNDGIADEQQLLLKLQTKGDYPHNGLSGIALQPDGKHILVGLGENVGMPYRLIGTDASEVAGNDGAGIIVQCTLDGRELHRVATGLWNPFGIASLPDGRMFAVDNDPDASPPCRLVHVVWGGDYGFRYQYGRAGLHPLQTWNGELPGTLPYVVGVGEAPTALVAHAGKLWATSWGDHRIDSYTLVPRGASYGAKREVVVQGGVDFRPTGMCLAPDGSIYFSDWVLSDYPVHGHGKVWRLTMPEGEKKRSFEPRSQEDLASTDNSRSSTEKIVSADPFMHAAGVWQLAHNLAQLPTVVDDRLRLGQLEVARLNGEQHPETMLRSALTDRSPDVRTFALRWIGDERLEALRDDVSKLLDEPLLSGRYYLTVLGAIDWLSHPPKMTGAEINEELLVRELRDSQRSPQAHALALSLLKPGNKFLTIEHLRSYLQSKSPELQFEAIRKLAEQDNSDRFGLLAESAQNESLPIEVRAEAIVGLSAKPEKWVAVFQKLAASGEPALQREAARALKSMAGSAPTAEAKPAANDIAAWTKLLSKPGDATAGRRLFFSPLAARCSVCHKYEGHGGDIGPNLSLIGRNTSREKIITSILQPSQEIAPDYQPWTIVTCIGKTYTGLRLPKIGDDGKEDYADSTGKVISIPVGEIEERRASSKSIMPDNLQSLLSIDELQDLVTFLAAPTSGSNLGSH